MIVFPNAKINLGLNITKKRNDGYHEIETVMYPIPLQDVLEIIPANETSLHTTGIVMNNCPMENNLVYKAWKLIYDKHNIDPVEIHLHKQIPHGAGLGGGSADAAFTITTLNEIFKLNLSLATMQKLAAELGSDCAMFIENKPVLAKGRGEILAPIKVSLKGTFLILITPPIHISTAEAYKGIKPQTPPIELKRIIEQGIETWNKLLSNDFENSIFNKHVELENIKANLYLNGASYAAMSGSGSAIFGLFYEKPNMLPEHSILLEL